MSRFLDALLFSNGILLHSRPKGFMFPCFILLLRDIDPRIGKKRRIRCLQVFLATKDCFCAMPIISGTTVNTIPFEQMCSLSQRHVFSETYLRTSLEWNEVFVGAQWIRYRFLLSRKFSWRAVSDCYAGKQVRIPSWQNNFLRYLLPFSQFCCFNWERFVFYEEYFPSSLHLQKFYSLVIFSSATEDMVLSIQWVQLPVVEWR